MPISINNANISTNNLAKLMNNNIGQAKTVSFARRVWHSIKTFFSGITYATENELQRSIKAITEPCNGDNGFHVLNVTYKMKLFKSIVHNVDEKDKHRFFCIVKRNNQMEVDGTIDFVVRGESGEIITLCTEKLAGKDMDGDLGINTFPVFDTCRTDSALVTSARFDVGDEETKDNEVEYKPDSGLWGSATPGQYWPQLSDVRIEIKVNYYTDYGNFIPFQIKQWCYAVNRTAGLLIKNNISRFFGSSKDKVYYTELNDEDQKNEFEALNNKLSELNEQIQGLGERISELKQPYFNDEELSSEWNQNQEIKNLLESHSMCCKQRNEIRKSDFFIAYKDTLTRMDAYNKPIECDLSDPNILKILRKDAIERSPGCDFCNDTPEFEAKFRRYAKETYDSLINEFGPENLQKDFTEIPQERLDKLKSAVMAIPLVNKVKLASLGMQIVLLPLQIPANIVSEALVVTDFDRRVIKYEYREIQNQPVGQCGEVTMITQYPIVNKNIENCHRYYYVQRETKHKVFIAENGTISMQIVSLKVRPAQPVISQFV